MNDLKVKLFRQRIFTLHILVGIFSSLLMYLAIFFGIFAIFLPYIQTWEKPSRYIQKSDITKIDYNFMLEKVLENEDFPKDNILINLPGRNGESAVSIQNRFVEAVVFDPFTKEILKNEDKKTSYLAQFLNELHYGEPLKLIGKLFFGFSAIGTLSLMLTGLILVYLFRFKYSSKNRQALFSSLHTKIFTWLFAPLLLICISGALMNVGLISSSPMANIISKGEAKTIDKLVGGVLFPETKPEKKVNIQVPMQDISQLLIKAKEINPKLIFKQIKIMNWKDKSARIDFMAYNPYKPFLNGAVFNIPYLSFDLHTGELIEEKKVMDKVWTVFLAESLFFLHFLFGIDIFSRTLVAFIMALCGLAIACGVLLYLEKKAKKYKDEVPFYHWMGKLSLFVMLGVVPASATLFVSQWLLPFDLEDRVLWQQGIFYNTWLFTLFWSFYRINSYKAAKEFFIVSGVLFIFSSFLHFVKYQVFISNILAVDITLVLFGVLLLFIGLKLPTNKEEFILNKIFNKGRK